MLIDLPRDLPRVMVDWRRIVQVLNNLLSNASRHSPESAPIRVSAVRDGVQVEISVSDEGRGVAPELLPHLFQKYRPAGVGPEQGLAGSGLGLAICKGLVEAHGGRIRAASGGVDKGMQVTFTIPVAEDPDADADADAARSRSRRGGEPTRILVVDDDPQTLHYLRTELAKAGYSPLVTGDPHAVPDLIREEEPALVLLDLMFPFGRWNGDDGNNHRVARSTGHLHLRLRQGRDHRQGAGERAPRTISSSPSRPPNSPPG